MEFLKQETVARETIAADRMPNPCNRQKQDFGPSKRYGISMQCWDALSAKFSPSFLQRPLERHMLISAVCYTAELCILAKVFLRAFHLRDQSAKLLRRRNRGTRLPPSRVTSINLRALKPKRNQSHLHGEDRGHKGTAPLGGGIFGGNGGREGVVTTDAEAQEEAPDAELSNDAAVAHANMFQTGITVWHHLQQNRWKGTWQHQHTAALYTQAHSSGTCQSQEN
jgi:hypothetical protein